MKRNNSYIKTSIYNNSQLENLKNKIIDHIDICIPSVKINMKNIPKSVTSLNFHYTYINLPVEIPRSIKNIYFSEYYQLIEDLPNNIENIQINKGFNKPVDKLFNNIKYIDFGNNFNQQINDLPSSLEKIVLGKSFLHQINNLPLNVKFIYIHNSEYNYLSIKILPISIIFLQIETNLDSNLNLNKIDLKGKKIICQTENIFLNYFFYKE